MLMVSSILHTPTLYVITSRITLSIGCNLYLKVTGSLLLSRSSSTPTKFSHRIPDIPSLAIPHSMKLTQYLYVAEDIHDELRCEFYNTTLTPHNNFTTSAFASQGTVTPKKGKLVRMRPELSSKRRKWLKRLDRCYI